MEGSVLRIGSSYSKSITASDQIIQDIAKVSGDMNPIHLNEDYAKKSIFGRRIAHGLFCQNIISMIIGNYLPGNGTILISQKFKYRKPVYIGDAIDTVVTVDKILPKGKYVLNTLCRNQNGDIVLEGEAMVKWQKTESL